MAHLTVWLHSFAALKVYLAALQGLITTCFCSLPDRILCAVFYWEGVSVAEVTVSVC